MPDHSHVTELLDQTHKKTQELSFLIDQAHALTVQMGLVTNWTTRLYQDGAGPVNFTMEQSSHVDHLLGCIESRDNGNSMRYHAANCRCIHCQGTHASEDHHLSVSAPPVCNPGHISLSPPLEQAQTTTVHNRPHNYKKNMQFSLPSQQSAFNTSLQPRRQWPLPPKPTPPTTSHRSTAVTASSTSTRKSPISSTINRMSGMLPPHPYCCTPPPPTKENGKRLSSSSRKSAPASGCSNDSLMPPMTMLQNSKRSSRTRLSTQISTGANLPGDQCCNGNSCCRRPNDASATPSASRSNRPIGCNPRADESDYDNNKTPYGDEVYNNID